MPENKILTVSALTERVKSLIESDPSLCSVFVRGELSNYKLHSSGHHYMTIKDDGAVLNAVMFRSAAASLKFRPATGMKIIARGRISVFPKSGQYQMYISELIPDGTGDLYAAFEQLREKLRAEGLFSVEKKKRIPKMPGRIAVVTSPTGAAIRDILRILGARFPVSEVIVCPVLVQGPGAAQDIASMIEYINRHALADLIIAGRGGGSIEDLWAFNEEIVARAIFASSIPIISAVGHEPDVTIADYVADMRAATPSNAAELAVPDRREISAYLSQTLARARHILASKIKSSAERLEYLSSRPIMASPTAYIEEKRMALLYSSERICSVTSRILAESRRTYVRMASLLDAMSPLKVLSRGYSIVSNDSGKILSSRRSVAPDDNIDIRFSDGSIKCRVLPEQKH